MGPSCEGVEFLGDGKLLEWGVSVLTELHT